MLIENLIGCSSNNLSYKEISAIKNKILDDFKDKEVS